jgi:hypothetical protein
MISLPDCSGFALFRATAEARKNTFGPLKSTPRRQPKSIKEALMPAKEAKKAAFCRIFVVPVSNPRWTP